MFVGPSKKIGRPIWAHEELVAFVDVREDHAVEMTYMWCCINIEYWRGDVVGFVIMGTATRGLRRRGRFYGS